MGLPKAQVSDPFGPLCSTSNKPGFLLPAGGLAELTYRHSLETGSLLMSEFWPGSLNRLAHATFV
jgi:hypothetical protein